MPRGMRRRDLDGLKLLSSVAFGKSVRWVGNSVISVPHEREFCRFLPSRIVIVPVREVIGPWSALLKQVI